MSLFCFKTVDEVRVLIERKADVNTKDNYGGGETYLHRYCKDIRIMRLLIEAKANVNIKNFIGDTPLHSFATAKEARLLIEAKADVNAKNKFGDTPLHLQKSLETKKLLIDAKANFNIKNNKGKFPYISQELLKLLLDERVKFKLNENVVETITLDFFKKNTKYIIDYICNYNSNKAIQKILKSQLN